MLFVIPTNNAEWNHNKTALLKVNQKHYVAEVSAESKGKHASKSSTYKASGLVRVLGWNAWKETILVRNYAKVSNLVGQNLGRCKFSMHGTDVRADIEVSNYCRVLFISSGNPGESTSWLRRIKNVSFVCSRARACQAPHQGRKYSVEAVQGKLFWKRKRPLAGRSST